MCPLRSLNLTPAESLTILDLKWTNPKKLLKLTFADLLLKKAIEVDVIKEKRLFSETKTIFVRSGRSLNQISYKPHEKVIIDHISDSNKKLRDLAHEVYSSLGSLAAYRDDYVRPLLLDRGYLRSETKKFLGIIPQTKYFLTPEGSSVQAGLKKLLAEGENFDALAREDAARARAYLSVCGGNVLLLDPNQLEIIEGWSKELSSIKADTDSYYGYYWYDYSWHSGMTERHGGENPLDLDDLGFDLPDLDFLDFDVLDSFDSFADLDSAFDSDFGGGDGGGDGGDGGGGGD